ncbi:MAG TPA: TetR/AcrR family transcriptional regulator [Acidimicrobiales bacterium]|nr:TetR/AcrR family transcriptional regulator [Acidimicrobiales bacterium]
MAVPAPPGDARQGVRSRRVEERRAELLDAAIRVIRRDGATVAMEAIAAECGISRPILYRHFGDVTGLYAAVSERFCGELSARLQRSGAQPGSGRALLHRQVAIYLAFVADDPQLYRFLVREAPQRRPSGGRRAGFSLLVADRTADYLVAAGWERPLAAAAADVFVGGLEAAADRWVDAPPATRGTHAALAERVTTVLWTGFEAISRAAADR